MPFRHTCIKCTRKELNLQNLVLETSAFASYATRALKFVIVYLKILMARFTIIFRPTIRITIIATIMIYSIITITIDTLHNFLEPLSRFKLEYLALEAQCLVQLGQRGRFKSHYLFLIDSNASMIHSPQMPVLL